MDDQITSLSRQMATQSDQLITLSQNLIKLEQAVNWTVSRQSALASTDFVCDKTNIQDAVPITCYRFEANKTLNWTDAEKFCTNNLNAHLVSIETREEQVFLENHIKENEASLGSFWFWTGGTDIAQQNTWVWAATGKVMNYTNWFTGEPNSDEERCVNLFPEEVPEFPNSNTMFQWNDRPCSMATRFICEWTI